MAGVGVVGPYPGVSEELLRELYVGRRLSMEQVGVQVGLGRNVVGRLLDTYGIAKRGPGCVVGGYRKHPEVGEELLRDLYERRRLPMKVVAAMTGMSAATIGVRLAEYGIATRRRSGPNPYSRPGEILTPAALKVWAIDEGLSMAEIARRAGCSQSTVLRYVRSSGLVVTRQGSQPTFKFDPAELGRLVADGWSAPRMARRYGCSATTVRTALREAGLTTVGIESATVQQPKPGSAVLTPEALRSWTDEGLSASEMARRSGFGKTTVLRHLRAEGVPIRPRGGSGGRWQITSQPAGPARWAAGCEAAGRGRRRQAERQDVKPGDLVAPTPRVTGSVEWLGSQRRSSMWRSRLYKAVTSALGASPTAA